MEQSVCSFDLFASRKREVAVPLNTRVYCFHKRGGISSLVRRIVNFNEDLFYYSCSDKNCHPALFRVMINYVSLFMCRLNAFDLTRLLATVCC
jgi:hypothetical protein